MMSRPLQILGALALLAWTAMGVFMWVEVKSHVTVTIAEASDGQSEESALVAERVATLSADLDALIAALDGNFTLVANAIGEGANEHAGRSAVIEQRLASLEAALPNALQARETAGALRASLVQVEAMLVAASARSARDVAVVRTEEPEEPEELDEPEDPEPVEVVVEAVPQPEVLDAPVPPPAQAKTSFLAFKLPSRDFQFEGEQTFEILGDLSRVGFDAKSTLHDFSGLSNNVSGSFKIDLAHPDDGISGSVSVETASLDTGLDARDEAMLEHLGSEHNPTIQYVFESFAMSSIDADAQTLEGTISGKMTINGTTKPLDMKISAHVDASRRLVIEGEVPLSRADYNVHVPGKLGLISTDDEVRIWIHLRSRARATKTSRPR